MKDKPEIVTRHLKGAGQPAGFEPMADLSIRVEDAVYPSHSSLLCKYSVLFSDLFTNTAKEGWANAIAAALQGHSRANIALLLAMMHGTEDVADMRKSMGLTPLFSSCAEAEDALRLAHKLDAPVLLKSVEKFVISGHKEMLTSDYSRSFQTINLACALGLKDLENCGLLAALKYVVKSSNPADIIMHDTGLEDGASAASFASYRRLTKAIARAMGDASHNRKGALYTDTYLCHILDLSPPTVYVTGGH